MNDEEEDIAFGPTRRIVVSDDLPPVPHEVRGRRLETPPDDRNVVRTALLNNQPRIRRSYLWAALGASVLLVATIAVLAVKNLRQREARPAASNANAVLPAVDSKQRDELSMIEDDAKQVIRRISRDNRPYSFNERSLRDIQSRVSELSRSPNLSDALREIDAKRDVIGSKAAKEGLQPSLVILLGLALTKGGASGNCVAEATKALPRLATLNKTFGSNEADSCLIMIAAFPEGPGTQRSHPLLKRMNHAVTNPLTERNVWFLNEQHVLVANAYALVIDTIAFGVITRSPRQFGLENEPLNF